MLHFYVQILLIFGGYFLLRSHAGASVPSSPDCMTVFYL